MGVAAYNRGSKAIRESIAADFPQREARIAYEPKPVFPPEEKVKPVAGSYLDLRSDPRMVQVGDRVFCTVTNCRGWMKVTAVRYDHRHVDIKTDTFGRGWGYGHNFTFDPPAWMTK